MSIRNTAAFLLVLVAGAWSGAAEAQRVYIDIEGATFRPYPLAIPRIAADPALESGASIADEVTERLRWDLEVSGLFQVLDPRSFLASPDEGMTTTTIKFPDWANVGAEGLLKARLSPADDGQVRLEVRLFGVTTAQENGRWTYTAGAAEARRLAHRAAGDVVEHFTGERAIFDTQLAFVRRVADRRKEIWISDWDGHGARRLVGGELNMLPAWGPDGDRLVFTSFRDGDPDVYQATLGGQVKRIVGGDAMYTGPSYSPDGARIAFTRTLEGNAEIFVADADGKNVRRLTDAYGVDTSPTWSPDGRRIAFVSTRHGNPHIFVMNADGTDQKRLTFQGNYNQTPDWSPRGDLIAFTARDERNVFDLFTVHADTGEITRLTQDTGNNEEPSFSPNGRHVVFTTTRGGPSRVWIMNADGTNQRALELPAGEYFTPAWGPWPPREGAQAKAATAPATAAPTSAPAANPPKDAAAPQVPAAPQEP